MRHAVAMLASLGVLLGLVVASGGHARVKASRARPVEGWSQPQVLAAKSAYSFDPQLAVSERGVTLAAWCGAPETPPLRAGPTREGEPRRPSGSGPAWSGSSVIVDSGTVSGGFGIPVQVGEHASDTGDGIDVAISGAGVRYVAWETVRNGWMIATAPPRQTFATARPLPAGFERLVSSPAGPVAAVWHMGQTLRYALLTAGGAVGQVVTLPGRFALTQNPIALNDRGAFAAVENTAEYGESHRPPHPVVDLCEASGRCLAPQVVRVGHPPAGSEENDALALGDDGALTVLAAFSKSPAHPAPNTPWGLWDTTREPGGRWTAPQELSNGGELPLAAPDGTRSAVTVFQHFWTPNLRWLGDRIEVASFGTLTRHFTHPHLVRDTEAPEPGLLATTTSGRMLFAWVNSGGIVGGEHITPGIYALLGSPADPGPPRLVALGEVGVQTPAAGVDRDGEGVILWSGPGARDGEGGGVYASTFGAR